MFLRIKSFQKNKFLVKRHSHIKKTETSATNNVIKTIRHITTKCRSELKHKRCLVTKSSPSECFTFCFQIPHISSQSFSVFICHRDRRNYFVSPNTTQIVIRYETVTQFIHQFLLVTYLRTNRLYRNKQNVYFTLYFNLFSK